MFSGKLNAVHLLQLKHDPFYVLLGKVVDLSFQNKITFHPQIQIWPDQ